jgi:hypothetical protein
MSRSRGFRLTACLILTVIIMCNTIKHMFAEVRPFDWLMLVVELLVLLLIAAEVIPGWLHWRHKRYATTCIMAFLTDGQRLQDTIPRSSATDEQAIAWIEELTNWILRVQAFLEKNAKQAVAIFNHQALGPRYSLRVHL